MSNSGMRWSGLLPTSLEIMREKSYLDKFPGKPWPECGQSAVFDENRRVWHTVSAGGKTLAILARYDY